MVQGIKPCAHCGYKDVEFTRTGLSQKGQFAVIRCTNRKCGCSFSIWYEVEFYNNKVEEKNLINELVRRWNKRTNE